MAMNKIALTTVILVCSSSLALAESGGFVHSEPWSGNDFLALTVKEDSSMTNGGKLEILESKVKELETRIDKFLPKTSRDRQSMGENPYNYETVRTMQGWSSQDHLLKAKTYHQKSEALDGKIQKLQDRIDRFSQKPYLDTKGFKRASLKVFKDTLVQELHEATTKTAWHKAQAQKIMISESTHQHHSYLSHQQ